MFDSRIEDKKEVRYANSQIGQGTMNLLSLPSIGHLKEWIPLYWKSKKVGDIQLGVTLHGVAPMMAFTAPAMS